MAVDEDTMNRQNLQWVRVLMKTIGIKVLGQCRWQWWWAVGVLQYNFGGKSHGN